MTRLSWIALTAILLSARQAEAQPELITCIPWLVDPAAVSDRGDLRVFVPGRGWRTVRPRDLDGPKPDAACAPERMRAMIARGQTMVSVANAGQVAFCAPRDLDGGLVEATVLVDGVELTRILADHRLAQPTAGERLDWCAQ